MEAKAKAVRAIASTSEASSGEFRHVVSIEAARHGTYDHEPRGDIRCPGPRYRVERDWDWGYRLVGDGKSGWLYTEHTSPPSLSFRECMM